MADGAPMKRSTSGYGVAITHTTNGAPMKETLGGGMPFIQVASGGLPVNIVDMSPGAMFLNNEQGIWLDPSDLSTVYQDAAGTIPGAVGSVVGLVLDKSKGLALGAEQWTTPPTSIGSGWTDNGNGTYTGAAGVYSDITTEVVTLGKWFMFTWTVSGSSAGFSRAKLPGVVVGPSQIGNGTFSAILFSTLETAVAIEKSDTFIGTVSGISVREIVGNHARQATTASKPILRRNATTGALYLEFDGVDDFLATAAIDLTATDEVTLFAGVRKLSDAATAIAVELSTTGGVAGSVALFAPANAGSSKFRFNSQGTAVSSAETTSAIYNAPISAVVTAQGKISTDQCVLRLNASQVATSATDQGTGNYGNYALYIGRRGGTSLPFNGHIYGLAIVGRTATAAEIASTEAYMNARTGAF